MESRLNPSSGIFSIWFACIFFTGTVLACNPAIPTVCQAYSRAEAVFIGKLIKTEKVKPGRFIDEVAATFEVEKVYKGSPTTLETIIFRQSACDHEINGVGQRYFVYKERYKYGGNVLNRTGPISSSAAEIEYAERIVKKKPSFNIGGFVIGLNPKQVINSYVEIGHKGKTVRVPLRKDGDFEFLTTRNGTYRVKLILDTASNIFVKLLSDRGYGYQDIQHSPIEYVVEFKPSECDFRYIEIGTLN